jgi:hypothetical protein
LAGRRERRTKGSDKRIAQPVEAHQINGRGSVSPAWYFHR